MYFYSKQPLTFIFNAREAFNVLITQPDSLVNDNKEYFCFIQYLNEILHQILYLFRQNNNLILFKMYFMYKNMKIIFYNINVFQNKKHMN